MWVIWNSEYGGWLLPLATNFYLFLGWTLDGMVSIGVLVIIRTASTHRLILISNDCRVDSNLQVLAYLLISASSSAATRVDDWQSNWGKDEFTEMATASVSMAFLAFIAFALSSLISGYNLFTQDSTWFSQWAADSVFMLWENNL